MTTLNATPDEMYVEALNVGNLPYTGRQIVTFNPGAVASEMASALSNFGPMAAASDFVGSDIELEKVGDAATVLFEETGTAILTPMAFPVAASSAELVSATPAIDSIDPELFAFTQATAPIQALAAATWGLLATDVVSSPYTGRGIKVAVLDTGFDLFHPDFVGRQVTASSFVPNQPVQDLHGHGTHCIGTACGSCNAGPAGRYGIACDAHIFAGKVLSNSGIGSTGGILAGINWAIANRCEIISMSLGSPSGPQPYYQQAALRALAAGSLIIAAAGNTSQRPGNIQPTGAPANSPDIVAVAALDPNLRVAVFSCGNKIELAGPGVDVLSAAPMPNRYRTMSGTSMATPHVAGIAALWAESNPALRGAALRNHLMAKARALPPLPATDVGSGLVQAV